MGLFGQSTTFEPIVEKATSETLTNENWELILDICDKVSSNPRNSKDCLKAILKRMGHNDPHVVMQSITLLDACVNNCGKPFHLEIASREFENEFRRLLSKAQPQVSAKLRTVLKSWAENDFRSDRELNLIPSLYVKLRQEGQDFSNLEEKPKSSAKTALPKDPNVVSSQQEEDDIAKAIELSLKETKNSPRHQASGGVSASAPGNSGSAYPSLYPSFSNVAGADSSSSPSTSAASASAPSSQQEARKVRALYDFEAAEDNELTFFTGEIIHVVDDSDPNWWKGYNQRGEGLFPSNFVTADLSVDPTRLEINQHQKKNEQFNEDINELQQKTDAAIAAAADPNQSIEIDEEKIDRLLHLLHEANPEDPTQDSEEMLRLEQEVHQMGPLIDAELERVDRKHAQLTQLSSDLVDAINLYHSLMRDDGLAMPGSIGGRTVMGGINPAMQMPGAMAPSSLGYQVPNSLTMQGAAGYSGAPNVAGGFPQQPPYGMTSLPFTGTGNVQGLPPAVAPTTHGSPMNNPLNAVNTNAAYSMTQASTNFQNGHINSTQFNGVGSPQQTALLQQHQIQQQKQQQPQQTNISNYSMVPQQQTYPQTTGNMGNEILQQLQQQQQQPIQQQCLPQQNLQPQQQLQQQTIQQQMPLQLQQQQQQQAAALAQQQAFMLNQQNQQFISPQHNPQQQQQLTYMSPQQHQQQQQQMPHPQSQYASLPNGQLTQAGYNTVTTLGDSTNGILQQLPTQSYSQTSTVNNPTMDNLNHLQHQMAAMSMGGMGNGGGGGGGGVLGINQPITQNFLNQNETKQNIPIYQQQR